MASNRKPSTAGNQLTDGIKREFILTLVFFKTAIIKISMSSKMRRFVFIDFENLKKVKFKKLEKVCDKLFIVIDANEKSIPFALVMNIQQLGKGVKWIVVNKQSAQNLSNHISFVMGKLHQKVDPSIEFAILSNNKSFDSLVEFINSKGRSCIRVKRKNNKPDPVVEEAIEEEELVINLSDQAERPRGKKTDNEQLPFIIDQAIDRNLIEDTAMETIERLKYSGNRPAKVLLLRDYILLHNQEFTKHGNADKIIDVLIEKNEIEIEKGAVKYNF